MLCSITGPCWGGGGGGGGVLEDVALEFCNKKECYICDVCQ